MKLTEQALSKFNQTIRLRLGLALGFSERWVIEMHKANKSNGPLTTAAALKVIREETGLEDSEILEENELMGEQK